MTGLICKPADTGDTSTRMLDDGDDDFVEAWTKVRTFHNFWKKELHIRFIFHAFWIKGLHISGFLDILFFKMLIFGLKVQLLNISAFYFD